jgi:hypothetical protein
MCVGKPLAFFFFMNRKPFVLSHARAPTRTSRAPPEGRSLPQPHISKETIDKALTNLANQLLALQIPEGTILQAEIIHNLTSQPSNIDFITP